MLQQDYLFIVVLAHLEKTTTEHLESARPVYAKVKELRNVRSNNLPGWFQKSFAPQEVVNITVPEDGGWAIYDERQKCITRDQAEQIIKEKDVLCFVNKLFFHVADRKDPWSDFQIVVIGCKHAMTIIKLYLELTKKLHSYVTSVSN